MLIRKVCDFNNTIVSRMTKYHSHLLKTIHHYPDCLELVNSDMSEGDYIVKAWGGIIEDIFSDDQLLVKWYLVYKKIYHDQKQLNLILLSGETVSTYSTDVRNNETCARKKIKDKVDFRVIIKKYNIDLLNKKIASNTTVAKYSHDNRITLRETQNIADQVYRSQLSNSRKMKKVQSIQIAGTKNEIAEVSLVDNGLYINNCLGSLYLSSGAFDIGVARTLICRLLDVKVYFPRFFCPPLHLYNFKFK